MITQRLPGSKHTSAMGLLDFPWPLSQLEPGRRPAAEAHIAASPLPPPPLLTRALPCTTSRSLTRIASRRAFTDDPLRPCPTQEPLTQPEIGRDAETYTFDNGSSSTMPPALVSPPCSPPPELPPLSARSNALPPLSTRSKPPLPPLSSRAKSSRKSVRFT